MDDVPSAFWPPWSQGGRQALVGGSHARSKKRFQRSRNRMVARYWRSSTRVQRFRTRRSQVGGGDLLPGLRPAVPQANVCVPFLFIWEISASCITRPIITSPHQPVLSASRRNGQAYCPTEPQEREARTTRSTFFNLYHCSCVTNRSPVSTRV